MTDIPLLPDSPRKTPRGSGLTTWQRYSVDSAHGDEGIVANKLSETAASARRRLAPWGELSADDVAAVAGPALAELGHAEGVSNLLSLASLDMDGGGVVTDAELEASREKLEVTAQTRSAD